MAKHSLKAEIHTCSSKRRFATLEEAQSNLPVGLKTYQCKACSGFHFTSRGADRPQSATKSLPESKPDFEPSLLMRAKLKKKPSGSTSEAVATAISLGKPRPNGTARVRIGKNEYELSEPIQPAHLRHLIQAGTKLKVSVLAGTNPVVRLIELL